MNMPNMKDAKIRTKNKVETIYDSYKLTKDLMKIGENKTFYLRTYGCQMNEHDSEKIKAILTDLGFKEILVMEKADLILFNTCYKLL